MGNPRMWQQLCSEENCCCHYWYLIFNFSGVAHAVWWLPFLRSWVSSIQRQFFWQLTLTSVRWEHPVWPEFFFSHYYGHRHLETLQLTGLLFHDSGIWQCSCSRMADINLLFKMSINLTLNDFLQQMLRLSVVEIASCV